MLRNEKGFTYLEGIISFGLILLIATSLFPLMFKMLLNIQEGKKEMMAYRLLYEHVEKQAALGLPGNGQTIWKNIEFTMNLEMNRHGVWHACVAYEKKKHCIE